MSLCVTSVGNCVYGYSVDQLPEGERSICCVLESDYLSGELGRQVKLPRLAAPGLGDWRIVH